MIRASGFDVRVHARIDDVEPDEWDAIVPADDLQARHRFVKLCQDTRLADARFRHFVIRRAGRPVCVGTLSCLDVRLDLLAGGTLRRAAGRVRRVWPSFLATRLVLGGLPASFGRSCLRFAPDADAGRILPAVTELADAVAREEGAGLIAFKEFTPLEAVDLDPLRRLGYESVDSLPSCTLAIRWPTFDAYLADMRSGYRRQVVAGLEARRRSGLRLRRVTDFGVHVPELYRLYGQVMDRAEFQLERLPVEFFRRLDADFGDASRALILERDGRIVAAAIVLLGPRSATFLLAGLDCARARRERAYPMLVAEVVAEAIRHGAVSLELGQTSYALKRRLGAVAVPRYAFLRHRGPIRHRLLRAASGSLFPARTFGDRRVFRGAEVRTPAAGAEEAQR